MEHMTARGMISSMTMTMVFLVFVAMGHCRAMANDDEFAETCARILDALRAENWTAFRKECADEIVLERIQRIYLQSLSAKETKELFREPYWINGDYRNGRETKPEDDNDRDLMVTHGVLMSRKPTEDERRAFHEFCRFVRDSYDRESTTVDWGRNIRGDEVKSLFGPAIEGKVASNFKWRVQLEEIDGHWKVRKLITEVH